MARTHRSSVTPVLMIGSHHWSGPAAFTTHGVGVTTTSGSPNRALNRHPLLSGHILAGGSSLGSPTGAPPSAHRRIVSFWSSVSEISLMNFCMPTVLSTNHGGISPAATLVRMERTHGRTSGYLSRDIGAILPG